MSDETSGLRMPRNTQPRIPPRIPPRAADRDPARVHWMELFFDLIFVALVGQLALNLHEHPTFTNLALFVALFASVWWAWVNLTFAVNVMPWLSRRQLALVMLAAMFPLGAIAVAAPEATGDRAWLFAAGNAALRLVLLGLWLSQSWRNGRASRVRVFAYNGLTAVLWFASIWVPVPWIFAVWALAIVLEVVLLITTTASWAGNVLPRLNVEHLTERFGLLVVIVLGESVLSIVAMLSATWSPDVGITAALALAAVALLAWSFFMYGTDAMRQGLESLHAAGRFGPLRDTVAFLAFLVVVGITAISGAVGSAIHHADAALPPASAVSLWGGIAVFYLTNAVISLRFGRAPREVVRWAVPALVLTALLAVAAATLPAEAVMLCTVLMLAVVVASAEWAARRNRGTAGGQAGGPAGKPVSGAAHA